MGIIASVLIGSFIGWVASKVVGRNHSFAINLVIGIVGSLAGSMLSLKFVSGGGSLSALTWSALLWSLIGAVVLLGAAGAITSRHRGAAH